MLRKTVSVVRYLVFGVLTLLRPFVCLAGMLACRLCILLVPFQLVRVLAGNYTGALYVLAFVAAAFAPVFYDLVLLAFAPKPRAAAR